jgi:hypothetical protein
MSKKKRKEKMKFKNGEFKYSKKRGVGRFLKNKNEIK